MSNIPTHLHLTKYYIPAIGYKIISPTKLELYRYGMQVGYVAAVLQPNHLNRSILSIHDYHASITANGESRWYLNHHLEEQYQYPNKHIMCSVGGLVYYWQNLIN